MHVSDADLVVLSLLAEQPRHGYDLDRVLEERGHREWTSIAFSSIYYVLGRLVERGWIEPAPDQPEPARGPRRTAYRVTAEGGRTLAAAAHDRLATPDRPTSAALPAIGAFPRLDHPDLVAALERRAASLTARLAFHEAARAASPSPHARAIHAYEIHRLRADRAWTRDLLTPGDAP